MINLLEPKVYNRISAGEVVERPASIVKELVENSLDAGATMVSVRIEEGGISSIEVSDNGHGIEKEDLVLAFTPHATSKIKTVEDLDNISSLGFRGEALASIASVCQVELSSRPKNNEIGYSLKVNGGQFGKVCETARREGTTLICKNLFYNTPVRAKFLKKPKTEEGEVTHLMEKIILSHPEIAFSYYVDGQQVYNTISSDLASAIYTIYGKEVYQNLIPVDYEEDGKHLVGYVTKPKVCKSNRTYQTLFVNGRVVENYLVSQAVQGVYENFLMKGKFPIYVLNLIVPVDSVDVNVHPSKKEVKFDDSGKIFGLVRRAVESALLSVDQIATIVSGEPNDDEGKTLLSPYNKQGFNPAVKPQEKLSATQGSSYIKIDHFDPDAPIFDVKSYPEVEFKKAPKRELPPDFADLKIEEKDIPVNKVGGPFFFDHVKESTLAEIKIEKNKFLNGSVLDEMKILGTIFKTYIVVEYDESVYFIDQHAAHERLLYDRLVKNIDEGSVVKQTMLYPYKFSLGAKERELLEDSISGLREIGFEIVNNKNTYEIKAIPLAISGIDLEKFVEELVKEGVNYDKKPSAYIHDKLCQSACKHAIKAGDSITKEDAAYLITEIRKGVMLCPHGRPVALELTKREFEKMFKRVL